jgi:hypothetical protein
MQKSRKLPSHTSLERPQRVELRSWTAAFESAQIKSYEPSKFADCCLNGDEWEFGKLGHQMAPFQSEFQVKKIHADLGCGKTRPQTKFQDPNMFCSREIKSQK